MLYGAASDISQQVLRTDVAGMPLEWIDYREAVRLYHNEQVAYACGTILYTVFGGYNASNGLRSQVEVSSIIATEGTGQGLAFVRDQYIPPLNNRTLFKRDANLCLYCATQFQTRDLTR
ncbi:MAG: HNH endonuclease, partial [Gammaproteobacteria bacterium]|nr:HNH endonuclease [Gammaproteobacteria bacterium]